MKKILLSAVLLFVFLQSTLLLYSQWEACNNGLTDSTVFSIAVSGNNIFVGTLNGVFLSTDNGTNWTQKNTGITSCFIVTTIFITGNKIFLGTGYYNDSLETQIGEVYVSTDNGNNWKQNDNALTHEYVHAFVQCGNNIFAGTTVGIFLSADNGNTWVPRNIGLNSNYVFSLATDGENVYAGADLCVYLSTNDGGNWSPKGEGYLLDNVLALTSIGNNIFAGIQWNNGIYLSTDYGHSWSQKNNGLNLSYAEYWSFAISGKYIFAGTWSGGVYLSSDNGDKWIQKIDGLTDTIVQALAISGNYIFAGTNNCGIYRAKLSDFGISVIEDTHTEKNFSLSPNPTQDFLRIQIEQVSDFPISIQIFDILGQKVFEAEIPAGLKEYKIDVSGLPPGIFLFKTFSGNQTETRKFEIIR